LAGAAGALNTVIKFTGPALQSLVP
jgi:hypothetical protein